MRSIWSAVSSPPDTFTLPHEVFELALKQGPLLVYLYLICRKSLKRGADEMNCAVIGKAVGLCEKIVRTHLRTLADTGFIKTEYHGQTFSYTLCPIRPKVQEHRGTMPHSRWISAKQTWINGEVLEAVFPLPNAVFQLGLKAGELLVYSAGQAMPPSVRQSGWGGKPCRSTCGRWWTKGLFGRRAPRFAGRMASATTAVCSIRSGQSSRF